MIVGLSWTFAVFYIGPRGPGVRGLNPGFNPFSKLKYDHFYLTAISLDGKS